MDDYPMKEIILSLGVFFTFLLGLWNIIQNHRNGKKTSFINTVTSERVAWMEKLRENISKFCGLTHTWVMSELYETEKEFEALKQIDELRYYIRLQLNSKPEAVLDREIEDQLSKIIKLCTPNPNQDKVLNALNNLIETTQKLLKEEWDKVKDESKRGDLSENEHFLDPIFFTANSWCLKKTKKLVGK